MSLEMDRLEDQELVLKPHKSVEEYVKMFRDAQQYDSSRYNDYIELLAYYEGEQNQLDYNKVVQPWVIKIDTPYAADAIDIRLSSLIANDYVGDLEPLSPDDTENILALDQAYKAMWKEMNMDNIITDAINRCAIIRESYVHIIYDDKIVGGTNQKRVGKLSGYFIDPASICIDPNALNFKDADYVVVVERVTRRKLRKLYPNFDITSIEGKSTPMERGEIYTNNDYTHMQSNALMLLTFYENTDDGVYKTIIVENTFIQKPEKMPIDVIPIAQLRWEKRMKSAYGKSLMDRLIAQQKSVNAVESAITTAALAFVSPSYAVRADSGVDPKAVAKLAGAPGVVFRVNGDPTTAITPISIKGVDGQLPVIKERIQENIYRLAGVSEQFLGSFGTAGNTSTGAKEALQRAKIVEQKFLRNLQEFIEDLTEIVVEFITKAFEGDRLYFNEGKDSDGTYNFNHLDITPDMKDLEYRFNINMDVKTPHAKENTKRLLQELYQFERQYDAPVKVVNVLDILRNYNIPNLIELEQRYKQLAQRDSASKAQLITQWVTITAENGINAEIISQGVAEIIDGKETPTVDQVLMEIQQMKQREAMQQQQLQQQAMQQQAQLQEQYLQDSYNEQTTPLTGDEEITMGDGTEQALTGDEEITMG